MNYIVKFEIAKEYMEDGKKVKATFPISYRAQKANSKDEALKMARDYLKNLYIGDDDKSIDYSIQLVDIKRIPENAPILPINYYEMYKSIMLDIEQRLGNDCEADFIGANGETINVKRMVDKKGKKEIIVLVGSTSITYNENEGRVILYNNPYNKSKDSINDELYIYYNYNNTVQCKCFGFGEYYIGKKSIEDNILCSYYGIDKKRVESLNNFLGALPQFSKESVAKKQAIIQSAYDEEFRITQERIIEEAERKENQALNGKKLVPNNVR